MMVISQEVLHHLFVVVLGGNEEGTAVVRNGGFKTFRLGRLRNLQAASHRCLLRILKRNFQSFWSFAEYKRRIYHDARLSLCFFQYFHPRMMQTQFLQLLDQLNIASPMDDNLSKARQEDMDPLTSPLHRSSPPTPSPPP